MMDMPDVHRKRASAKVILDNTIRKIFGLADRLDDVYQHDLAGELDHFAKILVGVQTMLDESDKDELGLIMKRADDATNAIVRAALTGYMEKE